MRPGITLRLLLLVLSGCATTFTGSAQIEGGRPGCEQKCASIGLQMQAFVFMGEYSSACVCDAPGRAAQAGRSAATVAVAVAVMKQLRDSRDDVCMEQDCGRFGD